MKEEIKSLKEKLFYENRLVKTKEQDKEKIENFNYEYKTFLNAAKTEREIVDELVKQAEQKGFKEFSKDKSYKEGDKIYHINRQKNIILSVIGKQPLYKGINILAAHIDSPRLDLKLNPLYESDGLAYFKTHYYGGIKKYQWVTIPLSLHGVVIKKDGEKININIGDKENDPVFCVNDLLPHLASKQMKRAPKDLIKGEDLNVLLGSMPYGNDKEIKSEKKEIKSEKELVKLNILSILYEQYGIKERDLYSAELSLVPAFNAKDVGFDRSLIGSYGHDDRVCAYTATRAIMECENIDKTAVLMLADKEETGSDGNTGMKSSFFKHFLEDLCEKESINLRETLNKAQCLSADVSVALDPNFVDVVDKKNVSYCGKGVAISKYTGSGGKYSTSEATVEFLDKITRLFDKDKISWQMCELGKVDEGGGGTMAKYLSCLNMDVLDVGLPVFSMHSPYEVVSKMDVYEAYRGYLSFLNNSV